jgi:hypothetical protein
MAVVLGTAVALGGGVTAAVAVTIGAVCAGAGAQATSSARTSSRQTASDE